MATDNEVQELIKELERLNLRQRDILRQLSIETGRTGGQDHRRQSRESTNRAGTQQQRNGLEIGDQVAFRSTATTRGGSGTIVRFTATRAIIRRANGSEVARAPKNVTKQQTQT